MNKGAAWSEKVRAGIIALCLILPLLAGRALAGSLEWTALPDRERVTIHLDPSEGMTAKIDRIAPEGVIIPFTFLPSGLLVNETPQGSTIFKNTRPLGRALVLVTQTPAFGFMVAKQAKQEIIVDFFHNPLGARWKAHDTAPVTEIAPETAVQPHLNPDAVSEALVVDPGGESAQSRFLAATAGSKNGTADPSPAPTVQNAPAPTPTPTPASAAQNAASAQSPASAPSNPTATTASAQAPASGSSTATPASAPESAGAASSAALPPPAQQPLSPLPQSAPGEGDPAGERQKPVVLSLSGSPEHALRATRMAEAPPPPATPPQANFALGAASGPGGRPASPPDAMAQTPPLSAPPPTPLPDARTQTAQRNSPLPLPEPPMSALLAAITAPIVPAPPAQDEAREQSPAAPAPRVANTSPSTASPAVRHPAPPPPQATQSAQSAEAQAPPEEAAAVPAPPSAPSQPAPPPQANQAVAAPPPQIAQPAAAPPSQVAQAPQNMAAMPATAPDKKASSSDAPDAQSAASRADRPAPPGVGVRARGGYRGSINAGGLENIPAGVFSGEEGAPLSSPKDGPGDPVSVQTGPDPDNQNGQTGNAPARAAADSGAANGPSAPAEGGQTNATSPRPDPDAAPAQNQANATLIIYTDEKGNPVEPPPTYANLHPKIIEHMKASEFDQALALADLLLEKATLNPEQYEDVLHIRSESLFALYKDDIPNHFTEIADAAQRALSYNPESRRNSAELLRLGYMNLHLNNLPAAEANFRLLRTRFPDGDNVALSYYYQGDYYYGRSELQKAADQFQHLIQTFPNSRYTRESALGLARSFYRMGYYDQAYNVVDYIQRRWGHFYIEYPPFLNMMGDVAFRLGKREEALNDYWLYINLEPQGDEADIILTRIGDIYSLQREKKSADAIYLESAGRYPDREGGLVAMMRMAEEGINDNPTIAGMFSIFAGPFKLGPQEVYRNIIEKHPESSLAPLAKVKLALWHLWNKDYHAALDTLTKFVEEHPNHELAPRAREIAIQTFAVLAAEGMQDERYKRMLDIWERYAIVHREPADLSPESRISLAVSYRQQGNPDAALRMLEPFFLGNWIPDYSEMALGLVIGIYLEYDQWPSIREVARRVEGSNMSAASRQQLDYAQALAAENLNEPDTAAPIWQRLYDSGNLPPAQHAYAAYFLAMGAERDRHLEKAYHLGLEALGGLRALAERSANPADLAKIRTQLSSLLDVTENAGRLNEALNFARQYLQALPENDPERMGVRYRMARIYKNQGDTDNWKSILGEIATQAPDSVYGKIAASELKAASIAEDAARYSPTGRI